MGSGFCRAFFYVTHAPDQLICLLWFKHKLETGVTGFSGFFLFLKNAYYSQNIRRI